MFENWSFDYVHYCIGTCMYKWSGEYDCFWVIYFLFLVSFFIFVVRGIGAEVIWQQLLAYNLTVLPIVPWKLGGRGKRFDFLHKNYFPQNPAWLFYFNLYALYISRTVVVAFFKE